MAVEDKSNVDEIVRVIKALSTTYVEIGIVGPGKKYEGGLNTIAIATIHEYGVNLIDKTGRHLNIPERSFIRASFDAKQSKFDRMEADLEKVINLEMDVDAFFKEVGEYCVGLIQEYIIEDLKSPALQPATIKAKGSSGLLRDTGNLVSSIDYKIRRGV